MPTASIISFYVLTLILQAPYIHTKDLKSSCSTCRQITDNFNKGFDRTAKKNFGGGNTAWEEKTLSKYETSEIRLVEILEDLCDSSSFECNQMVEEHEDHFETWWFKRKSKHPDLFKWFCIDTIKVCCPNGTFGPDCNGCVGGSERPCHGNGLCDGEGTRGGNGKCSCNRGYKGEFCLECRDGYFNEQRNDTFSLCTECHSSCKTCTGATHKDCDECKDGWEEDDNEACIDVDECSKDSSSCKEDQYCLNTEGSFSCKACDKACSGCKGHGPDQCTACAEGYTEDGGECTDVNECEQPETVCTEEHQECRNTVGSYTCECSDGFHEEDGVCIPTSDEQQHPSEDQQAHNANKPEEREEL
ncbi:hypothetical protein ACEWY4_001433 [Coilia grayii]|uniref:EGF-like domain-containing protein n=1 Tax=Coilia grayii TaxID=363190 RepID=A0ABD1KSX3_9TELE